MTSTQSFTQAVDEIVRPLWWAGWNIRYTFGIVTMLGAFIGYQFFDAPYLLGFTALFFGAPAVAVAGVWHVRQHYKAVQNGFHQDVIDEAEGMLHLDDEDNASTYTFYGDRGSKILRPASEYVSSSMVVTDYSVTIYDGNTISLPTLERDLSESTEEIYFDQVAGVNYDEDERRFYISRSDGAEHSWPSERDPGDALEDIQKRVRNYKREAVA